MQLVLLDETDEQAENLVANQTNYPVARPQRRSLGSCEPFNCLERETQRSTLHVTNSVPFDPKKMICFSDAVALVRDRRNQLAGHYDELVAQEGKLTVGWITTMGTCHNGRHRLIEKHLIFRALCKGALELHARLTLPAVEGGVTDWQVPRLSPREYLKGLRVLSLGSEKRQTVRELWHSEAHLCRKAFLAWLNGILPLPKGAWSAAAESRAVESLGALLKVEPNYTKSDCLEYLCGIYPSMPQKAFNNRIWGNGRASAGLSERSRAGRKPVREQSIPQ